MAGSTSEEVFVPTDQFLCFHRSMKCCVTTRKRRFPILFFACILVSCVVLALHDQMREFCFVPHIILWRFPRLSPRDNTDVTIVTAFFDLGTFRKGDSKGELPSQLNFTPQKYLEWGRSFQYLQNPLVIFTDSAEMEECFRAGAAVCGSSRKNCSTCRQESGLAETKRHAPERKNRIQVVRVYNRTQFFAFQKLNRVREIFADPTYPKFSPNTVLPEYACTQHAKVDLVERAILEDYFQTKYYAWMDIGYFRRITFRKRKFWITVPPELNDSKVAVNEVLSPPDDHVDPDMIFKKNALWVGGGMLLGTAPVLLKFVEEYHRAVQHFLDRGLFNTDQQMIYSMYKSTSAQQLGVTTQLQLFGWRTPCWFYLGYKCYKEE